MKRTLKEYEKLIIQMRLTELGGNRTKTAKSLGIGIRTLQRRLHQYKLEETANEKAN